nr:MAG TPA: Lysozyme [Caudoviricetes sp.]
MTINNEGLNLIKESEGLRLKAYKCPAGVWTIGYGHTGKDVKKGMVITEEKATELLKRDIERFERHVSAYDKIYHFTSNEFSALVSFAFNLGSITGLTKNGTRTKQQIANKMLEYCYASGKKLNGLYTRRQKERKLFLKKSNEYEVTGNLVRIRSGNTLESGIITTVNAGTKVTVEEKNGDFYKIRAYISKKYLREI